LAAYPRGGDGMVERALLDDTIGLDCWFSKV
jgi:hypothetical protein